VLDALEALIVLLVDAITTGVLEHVGRGPTTLSLNTSSNSDKPGAISPKRPTK